MNSNRMNEVVARVVAWHNRHPLARRITAAQVNSVGVVALPFATTAESSGGPVRADLIAPRMIVEPSFSPPTLDAVVEPEEVAKQGAGETVTEKLSLHERAKTQAAESAAETTDATEADDGAAPAAKPPRAKFEPKRLLRALGRLIWRGSRTGFQSVFNEDFIAPLSPKQVARWALLYGSTTRPGEPDWPLREVAPEPELQSKAFATPGVESVTLYLTTAAIDTPRGRLRVLLGRNGLGQTSQVLGSRDLSRLRMALGGALAFAALALAGWGYLHQPAADDAKSHAPIIAEAASAAASASPASAAQAGTVAASAVIAKPEVPASAAPESTPASESPKAVAADQHIPPASSASSAAVARTPASAATMSVAKASAAVASVGQQRIVKSQTPLHSAPASAVDMGLGLRGKFSIPDEVKQAALLEGKRLRASAAQAGSAPTAASAPTSVPRTAPAIKPGPDHGAEASKTKAESAPASAAAAASAANVDEGPRFYALVTKPSRSRAEAQARMILLSNAAANAIAPRGTRIELLQTQDTWQAVWWPFAKRDDAERARHLLTVRGVLVEMVAF